MSVLQDFLTGRNVPSMNENAILNVLVDVDFLEGEFKRIGRSHLTSVFGELRSVSRPPYLVGVDYSDYKTPDYINSPF